MYISEDKFYFVCFEPDEADKSYDPAYGRTLYSINVYTHEVEALLTGEEGTTPSVVLHDLGDSLLFMNREISYDPTLSTLTSSYYLYNKQTKDIKEFPVKGRIVSVVENQIITSMPNVLHLHTISSMDITTSLLFNRYSRGVSIHNDYIYLGASDGNYYSGESDDGVYTCRVNIRSNELEELVNPMKGYYIPYASDNQVALNYTRYGY